jgi:hypothetical protein
MIFERSIGKKCYKIAKIVADDLNDNPKISNRKFIELFSKYVLKEERQNAVLMKDINLLIDFVRDSLVIHRTQK